METRHKQNNKFKFISFFAHAKSKDLEEKLV